MKKVNLKLVVTLLLFLFMAVVTCQQGFSQVLKRNQTGKEYIVKLQKEMSWESYQDNRLKSAKARAKAKKQQEADRKKEVRLQARIRRIEG